MERDNKILISAILIVGIAIFASSLNTGISGRATGRCTPPSATVDHRSGPAGSNFQIDIVGEFAVPVDIVASDGRVVESYRNACSDNTCDGGSITVRTLGRHASSIWQDDTYCPKVRDLCTKVGGLRDRKVLDGGCFGINGYIDKWGKLQK